MRKLFMILAVTCGLLVVPTAAGATPLDAYGCNGSAWNPSLFSCITLIGSGAHVASVAAAESVALYTGGPWVGHFTVTVNGDVFLQSGQKTEYNYSDSRNHGNYFSQDGHRWWTWTWTNGGNGWDFYDGTVVCAGYLTMHGDWFGGGNGACKTIQA